MVSLAGGNQHLMFPLELSGKSGCCFQRGVSGVGILGSPCFLLSWRV